MQLCTDAGAELNRSLLLPAEPGEGQAVLDMGTVVAMILPNPGIPKLLYVRIVHRMYGVLSPFSWGRKLGEHNWGLLGEDVVSKSQRKGLWHCDAGKAGVLGRGWRMLMVRMRDLEDKRQKEEGFGSLALVSSALPGLDVFLVAE